MSRITQDAEDVTYNPTVNDSKRTASAKSTFNDSASARSGGEEAGKRHSFSRTLAKEIYAEKRKLNPKAKNAVHECIVLKYLAHKVRASKNIIDGKKWFYDTIKELVKIFPYLGGTTIYEIVIRLEKLGYLEISNFNKWRRDKTFWYHVPNDVCQAAESDLLYFDSFVAKETNVPAAVLFGNFEHWIKQGKEQESPLEVELSPSKLVGLVPFSLSTIKFSLVTLERKHIKKLSKKEPLYGLPEVSGGLNPNSNGLNPNGSGSNPNSDGSNPNDVTYCKSINNPLENPSKAKPAAFLFEDVSDDKKANDEPIHLLHDDMAACADGQDGQMISHGNNKNNSASRSSPATKQLRSFSFFDAPLSLQPADVLSVATSDAPSATDIVDQVDDFDGKWPVVNSLQDLHQTNSSYVDEVTEFSKQHDVCETFRQTIRGVCAKTMAMLDASIADALYDDPDGDEVIKALLPHFQRLLDQAQLNPNSRLSQIIFHAGLECMVGAFLWPREKIDSYSHPIHELICVTHKLYLVLWQREEDARTKAIEEERNQWRKEFASVDEYKEGDASLPPAEKMRVLRNALHARNKVGWIFFDQVHRTNKIQISKKGRERIQRLFELNPHLTPADLLPIMDRCMKFYCAWPSSPKQFRRGDYWHSRMGHRLHIFASYLRSIVKELDIASPIKIYLPDAKLEEDVALAAR